MYIYESPANPSTAAANDHSQKYAERLAKTVDVNFNEIYKESLFSCFAEMLLISERRRCLQGAITIQTLAMYRSRINSQLMPYFGNHHPCTINTKKINEFIDFLFHQSIKAITIKQYLGILKRILLLALDVDAINRIPSFPKLLTKSIPRGSFSLIEYKALCNAAKKIESSLDYAKIVNHRYSAMGAFKKTVSVPVEMKWLIRFMVNSFIRPVDIKLIQHKHITIIDGPDTYLRLNLPETKSHQGQVVTMRVAKSIYEKLKQYQSSRGFGSQNDYLFLPEVSDRNGAIQLITTHFRKILIHAGLRKGQYGQMRTLYSLRHTAITFRLLYGSGIDLLTLARNARTSVEMIEKFYSSNLTPEMNIKVLQSKRNTI
jgi:hypothetical protein